MEANVSNWTENFKTTTKFSPRGSFTQFPNIDDTTFFNCLITFSLVVLPAIVMAFTSTRASRRLPPGSCSPGRATPGATPRTPSVSAGASSSRRPPLTFLAGWRRPNTSTTVRSITWWVGSSWRSGSRTTNKNSLNRWKVNRKLKIQPRIRSARAGRRTMTSPAFPTRNRRIRRRIRWGRWRGRRRSWISPHRRAGNFPFRRNRCVFFNSCLPFIYFRLFILHFNICSLHLFFGGRFIFHFHLLRFLFRLFLFNKLQLFLPTRPVLGQIELLFAWFRT